jgi:uncharacterized membrane protein
LVLGPIPIVFHNNRPIQHHDKYHSNTTTVHHHKPPYCHP